VDPEDALGAGLSVSISGGSGQNVFGVVASTGQLYVAAPLKFETAQSYSLELALKDSGAPEGSSYARTTTASATVTVGHVNKAPSISTSPCSFSVNENAAASSPLSGGPLLAADPDVRDRELAGDVLVATAPSFTATLNPRSTPNPAGYSNPQAYSGPTPVVFAANSISVSPSSGSYSFAVSSGAAFDFETTPSFSVTVLVTDAGIDGAPLQASTTCTVTVVDVNEAPWFTSPLFRFSASQNAPLGTVVGTAIALDQDYGDVQSYSLTSSAGSNNTFLGAPVFSINNATGAVTISKASAELLPAGTVYCQALRVTDVGGLTNAAASTVCVLVVASNNPPVVFASSFSVPENAASGVAVGAFNATDPQDYPMTFTILSGNVNSAFAINSATGAITVASGALNFLSISSYALVVQATNTGAGSSLSSSATVTVSLVEVNKAPYFVTPTMALSVNENAASGAAVGSLSAADPNTHSTPTSRTDALKYYFADGVVAPFFSLNENTGAITVASDALLDYEAAPTYSYPVVVRDSGWDTVNVAGVLSGTGTVVISLANRNDAPTAADQSLSVNENAGASAAVGAVAAADQDVASSGQTLGFSLPRTDSVCWAFTSLSGGLAAGASFVPLPLQAVVPAASAVQTVYARVQSLAAGGTAFLVLSSAAAGSTPLTALAADRFVISLSASGTSVFRCTGATCGAALAATPKDCSVGCAPGVESSTVSVVAPAPLCAPPDAKPEMVTLLALALE
jgi:hypothetical protein